MHFVKNVNKESFLDFWSEMQRFVDQKTETSTR